MLTVVPVKLTIHGPCCVPGPPGESKAKRTQLLLVDGLTSCKINKTGVQMQKLAKCCRRGAKCPWVSEAREKTCQLESVRQGVMEVVASETDIDKLGNIFSNRGELFF